MIDQFAVVAFIPVIHRGYMDFLTECGAQKIFLVDPDDVPELGYLKREIRAIRFEEAQTLFSSLGYKVFRFSSSIDFLMSFEGVICMPNEDVSRVINEKYLQSKRITFIDTFLRWDWKNSVGFKPAIPDADRTIQRGTVEREEVSRHFQKLVQEQLKSSDWWRQVSSMIVCRNGQVLVAYNEHKPNEYVPYIDGDPRNNFGPGEYIEVSTALHSEPASIARAAKLGFPLEGADMYVSTFPCAGCAYMISETGIRRLFFTGGYSNLNGVKALSDKSIELIYIEP